MARIQISNAPSGRIIVSFPYDPILVSKVKTIEGRKWQPTEKHWSFQPTLPSPLAGEHYVLPSPLRGEGRGEGDDFEDLRRELVSRKYSYKTINGYLYYNKDFVNHVRKNPSEIRDDDIKNYLVYLAENHEPFRHP